MSQIVRDRGLIIAWVACLILAGGPGLARAADLRRIVSFVDGTPLGVQQQVVVLSGSRIVHTLTLITALAIELPAVGTAQALAILAGSPVVQGIDDDPVAVANGAICIDEAPPPIPERYPWGLQQVGMFVVREQWPNVRGAEVTVAVVDTGIQVSHPELGPRITSGYNALDGGGAYTDNNGHGTHIAGIIAAAMNSLGVIGAASQARLAAVKVLDYTGAGHASDLIDGLQWVDGQGIRLANLSLGFVTDSPTLRQATQRLANHGVILVAAAGNRCPITPKQDDGGGDECLGGTSTTCPVPRSGVLYPAAYPWVIAVGATDTSTHVTAYSLAGPEMDLVAPGGDPASLPILSTHVGSGYGWGSGTSQAAAHVTGALALALQLRPQLTVAQVQNLLQDTAIELPGYSPMQQGAGLLDVPGLLQALP
jgi:subtilisin